MGNTYKQDKNFKNYEFSKGEELTEKDLEAIASRSRTYDIEDDYLEESYIIHEANLDTREKFDGNNGQFVIGNNKPNSL